MFRGTSARNVSAGLAALPVDIWQLHLILGHEARPVVSGKPHAGAYQQDRSQAAFASSATLYMSRCRSTILTAMACIRSLGSTRKLLLLSYARYRPKSQLWQIQFSPIVSHNLVHKMSPKACYAGVPQASQNPTPRQRRFSCPILPVAAGL